MNPHGTKIFDGSYDNVWLVEGNIPSLKILIVPPRGTLRSDNGVTNENAAENRLRVPWNFFALIRSHTAVLESRKVGLELKRGNRFWVVREILKFIALLFLFSSQLKIWSFHIVVLQRRLWNLQKAVMHVQSCCFAQINLLSFRRSRCRRRSNFVRSQCTANTQSRTKNSLNLELKQ